MNFLEKFKAVTTMVLATLGLKELPIKDGKLDLSENQKLKLQEHLGEERVAEMIQALDKELSNYHNEQASAQDQLQAIDYELKKILGTHSARNELSEEDNLSTEKKLEALGAQFDAVNKGLQEANEKIRELSSLPEMDNPLLKNKEVQQLLKHSKTHLFSSGKLYDELSRNWNARVLNPSLKATDYSDPVYFSTLNRDLEHYYRENPKVLESLERDNFDLPEFWGRIWNVSDKIATASVVTANVTQARKLKWLPNNKHHIEAEEGQVYPIQIDLQYSGFYLQRIEASWLNFMNKEGSQAHKMSFVAFLVNEIRKVLRGEDRAATINGVYVPTPENAEVPGRYLNRQNGLKYLLWNARDVTKKYRAFNLGSPTSVNIVDYIDKMIDYLPEEVKIMQGLKFYLSPYWLKAYKIRYKQLNAQNTDYEGLPTYPENYPNIEFCTLVDFEGSDFMFITPSDNIDLLGMLPAEGGLFHLQFLIRDVFLFGDYKMGIMLKHIGNSKIKADDPEKFKVQTVWSNNVPIFDKRYKAYQYDDKTGIINAHHNFLAVNPDWETDITEITPLYKGQVIRIFGEVSLKNSKYIKKGKDLNLTADFDLKSGGVLTLISEDKEGKWSEINRSEAPEKIPTATEFTTVIDADLSNEYQFNGVGDTILDNLINGIDTQIINIYGGSDGKLTIPNSLENVKIDQDIVLEDANSKVQLVQVNQIWYEQK